MEKVVADLQFRGKWKTFPLLHLVSSIAVSCCGDKEMLFAIYSETRSPQPAFICVINKMQFSGSGDRKTKLSRFFYRSGSVNYSQPTNANQTQVDAASRRQGTLNATATTQQTVEVGVPRGSFDAKGNQETTSRRKFNDPEKAVNSLIKQAISEPLSII